MTSKEIISFSQVDNVIYIVKEALFCKVYEESAWRFYHLIRAYKPNKKYVKLLSQEVVTIGFPKTQIENIVEEALKKGYAMEANAPSSVVIRIKMEPDMPFEDWKQQIKTDNPGKVNDLPAEPKECSLDIWSVIDELKSFSIVNNTPMQSMQFLMDLQQKARLVRKMPE